MPVSLRLTAELSERIAKLVAETGTNAHAFMLEALREKVSAEEAKAELHAEAERRLRSMKKTGKGVPGEEVFAYLRARIHREQPERPKARKHA